MSKYAMRVQLLGWRVWMLAAMVVLFAAVPAVAAGERDADNLLAPLMRARVEYDRKLEAGRFAAGKWFDEQTRKATADLNAGKEFDLKRCKEIAAERTQFEALGVLPERCKSVVRDMDAARNEMVGAYKKAIARCFEAGRNDLGDRLNTERQRFESEEDLVSPRALLRDIKGEFPGWKVGNALENLGGAGPLMIGTVGRDSYRIRMDVERLEGTGGLLLELPANGESRFIAMFDDGASRTNGFCGVDNNPICDPETRTAEPIWPTELAGPEFVGPPRMRTRQIEVTVRPDSLEIRADGVLITSWEGDAARLKAPAPAGRAAMLIRPGDGGTRFSIRSASYIPIVKRAQPLLAERAKPQRVDAAAPVPRRLADADILPLNSTWDVTNERQNEPTMHGRATVIKRDLERGTATIKIAWQVDSVNTWTVHVRGGQVQLDKIVGTFRNGADYRNPRGNGRASADGLVLDWQCNVWLRKKKNVWTTGHLTLQQDN